LGSKNPFIHLQRILSLHVSIAPSGRPETTSSPRVQRQAQIQGGGRSSASESHIIKQQVTYYELLFLGIFSMVQNGKKKSIQMSTS